MAEFRCVKTFHKTCSKRDFLPVIPCAHFTSNPIIACTIV
jgi:hypothetical protein